MAARRAPLILGLTLAGAGGYYLYTAGGDPKVAQKKIEHDAHAVSPFSTKGKEVQKSTEEFAAKAGSKLDQIVDQTRAETRSFDKTVQQKAAEAEAEMKKLKSEGVNTFNNIRKETGRDLSESVDKFDKTVEKKASEAKSGISSWFGFGK
ncbi:hypothetical protein MMC09_000301 [Bachmanniomyces sp. S44760]|nr:hypothetical protein [Bachmanniomyces sp. S44760]